MLAPFFSIAMRSPGRQLAFRRLATIHLVLASVLVLAALQRPTEEFLSIVAQLFLVLGIVEGAAAIGWRLTQLPKSIALEFLLASPVQPRRLFGAEVVVGVGRFALVSLAGAPVIAWLGFAGVLLLMPFAWGLVAGVGLTAWVYEPRGVKRLGEILGLIGVLIYLVIGVMAGEHLRLWLEQLPPWLGRALFDTVMFLHTMNPFGVLRYWFDNGRAGWIAWDRMVNLHAFAVVLLAALAIRGACRLRGHFQDRHYRPLASDRPAELERIGERPLSWWAVRRVMEYSGRVNLWLAVGFAGLYSAYIVAGDAWPPWMGKLVFALFDGWGGPAMMATALAVLAAVPAVYQFGLWDATATARCRRLELLLLTDLTGRDYAHASFSAAWKRGRGYLVGTALLALALAVAGRVPWWDTLAALFGAAALWLFAFAVGYRGFASGNQTNGVASLFTLGLPLALVGLWHLGQHHLAALLPTAAVFVPLKSGVSPAWAIGFLATALGGIGLLRRGLTRCDRDLRNWFDANQGRREDS
jgi:hypothetical protein